MTYTINISPQFSEKLNQTALAKGIDPTKLLESLVDEYVRSANIAIASDDQPSAHF